MGFFSNKPKADVNTTDVYKWPLNKYPQWLLNVINENAMADFKAAYPQNVQRVGFSKWLHGKDLTWETAPVNWRNVFRERAVLSVFPAIVNEMNKPRWDEIWIEEYEDYHGY